MQTVRWTVVKDCGVKKKRLLCLVFDYQLVPSLGEQVWVCGSACVCMQRQAFVLHVWPLCGDKLWFVSVNGLIFSQLYAFSFPPRHFYWVLASLFPNLHSCGRELADCKRNLPQLQIHHRQSEIVREAPNDHQSLSHSSFKYLSDASSGTD